MTAPLTMTRKNKEAILKEIIETSIEMLTFAKSGLDRMDMRKLKEVLNNLNLLRERGKPS